MWDPTGVTDMGMHHNLIANADHRLPGMSAQTGRVINNVLRDVYLEHARYAATIALALWAVTLIGGLAA